MDKSKVALILEDEQAKYAATQLQIESLQHLQTQRMNSLIEISKRLVISLDQQSTAPLLKP